MIVTVESRLAVRLATGATAAGLRKSAAVDCSGLWPVKVPGRKGTGKDPTLSGACGSETKAIPPWDPYWQPPSWTATHQTVCSADRTAT